MKIIFRARKTFTGKEAARRRKIIVREESACTAFIAKAGGTPTYRQKQEKVSPEGARRICSSAADLGLILCEGGAGDTRMVLSRRICAKAGGTPTYRQKQEKVSPEGARRICSSAADLGLILCEGGAGNTCMVLSRRICAKADKRCGEVRMRIAPDGRKEKKQGGCSKV